MEMGKVTPAYQDGEQVRQWRVPVEVFMTPSGKKLEVVSIYEDEGFLCIDVQEPKQE